jgi:hypothetical protein
MFVFVDDFSKTTCEKCGGSNIIQIEYPPEHPDHYDGISETLCLTCGTRTGRWSGKELGINEFEKRYGSLL